MTDRNENDDDEGDDDTDVEDDEEDDEKDQLSSCETVLMKLKDHLAIDHFDEMMKDLKEKVEKISTKDNPCNLSPDEIFAITAYSHINTFSQTPAQHLWNRFQQVIDHLSPKTTPSPRTISDEEKDLWNSFLTILNGALEKLPIKSGMIFRTVGSRTKADLDKLLSKLNQNSVHNDIEFWGSFSSREAASEYARSKAPFVIIFEMDVKKGRDSSDYSSENGPDSLIILPRVPFKVTKKLSFSSEISKGSAAKGKPEKGRVVTVFMTESNSCS